MAGTTGGGVRRAGTFLPLLLLVLVALIVGFLNTNLVEPYTSPRAVADDHGAYLFYDTAERGPSSDRAVEIEVRPATRYAAKGISFRIGFPSVDSNRRERPVDGRCDRMTPVNRPASS